MPKVRRRSLVPVRAFASTLALFALLGVRSAAAQDPAACAASASWVNSPQMQLSVPAPEPFCAFHQFAWQNFLALIQNNGYLSFMPSINVFVASGTPMPWTNKPNPLSLGQIHKEAGDENPLIAQSGQMTQFDIRMNRSFYNYIVQNQLWNTKGFNALCTAINPPTEKQDPQDPLGSLELKTAWLPMACDPRTNQYVCSSDRKYGLVGFHLVQKISDHQEWIWATFEHVGNAPDCSALDSQNPLGGPWTYYNGKHQPCGGPGQPVCSAALCSPACNVFQQTGGPSNVCRQTPIASDGTTGTGGGPLVVNLNQSVHSLLTNPQLLALKNYNLVGTLWFKPGLTAPPAKGSKNPPDGQIFIGSTELANTTMETYLQSTNCYSCHVTASFTFDYNKPGTAFGDAVSSEADFSHMFRIMQGPEPANPCGASKQKARVKLRMMSGHTGR